MIKQQLFIGAALFVGVATGYFMRGESAAAKSDSAAGPSAKLVHRGRIADAGDTASNAALRRRVEELERLLVERAESTNEPPAMVPASAGDHRRSPREFFEAMKKNEPARYAQMTNRMANFVQRQRQRTQSRLEFLDSVDTSSMSAEARRTHERFQDLLVQREELREGFRNFDLSDDERRENFEKLRKLEMELNAVNRAERRNLLDETARALGLGGDDAAAFSATIDQVVEATDGSDFRPHIHRPQR